MRYPSACKSDIEQAGCNFSSKVNSSGAKHTGEAMVDQHAKQCLAMLVRLYVLVTNHNTDILGTVAFPLAPSPHCRG